MSTYRRAFVEGATYFFTAVTYNRLPILTTDESRAILHDAWLDVQGRFPFTTVAVCLLPEHLHCIWSLPEGETDYPVRWKEIKRLFTKGYVAKVGLGEERNESRLMKGEAAIWQRRYWEHVIRDEQDLRRHEDCVSSGYHPLQPCEAWVGAACRGLAVVEFSSIRSNGILRAGLGSTG
jgi:putative transposase